MLMLQLILEFCKYKVMVQREVGELYPCT